MQPSNKFSQMLQAVMQQRRLGIRDLAQGSNSNYESVRRVVAGDAPPSRFLFDRICEFLKLNRVEMQKLWLEDRLNAKYGKATALLSGKNPELQPIEAVWPHISEGHRRDLVLIAQLFANQDRGTPRKSH